VLFAHQSRCKNSILHQRKARLHAGFLLTWRMAIFYMKWIKFSVVALFAAAFIGLILYVVFMQDSIRSSNVEPPLITAPEQAVKRRPDQPGGMQIPNQDKLVFDLLDTSGTQQVEMEEPSPVAVVSTDDEPVVAVADIEDVTESEAVIAVEEPKIVVVTPTQVVAAKVVTPVAVAKVEPVKEEPTVEAKPAVAGGAWGVQLASVKAKADADAALKKLSNQFSALRNLEGRVQAATVNGSSSYRIQFVGSATREDAASVCKTLGSKQPCFPVKK
jgi:hypothetical protein